MKRQISSVIAALLLGASFAHSQVPVAMAPPIHFQFFSSAGLPLSNGKIFTYAAGTTTLQNTYVDAGGITQNPDPIPLDSSGSPSNGSTQTGIFLSNASWKFVAYDQFNVFQWSVDNVSTYFALLNSSNTWTATQTFSAQIIDTLTDNQFAVGSAGNQTTLDFPPPAGNIALHFPNTADTMVGRATTDALSNKTLVAPIISSPVINGVTITSAPGVYTIAPNSSGSPTVLNGLVVLSGATVAVAPTSATGGIIGACVSGCGGTGFATIEMAGSAECNFDGTQTAGDYIQISSTVAGDCHDSGSTYPLTGQVMGRVTGNFAGAATNFAWLFGPEIRGATPSSSTLNKQDPQGSPTTGTGSDQTVYSYSMPGGSLASGKCLNVFFAINHNTGTASLTAKIKFGATTVLSEGFTNTVNWSITAKVCNYAGSVTTQWGFGPIGGGVVISVASVPAENTAAAVTILATASVANTDTWTGAGFTVVAEP